MLSAFEYIVNYHIEYYRNHDRENAERRGDIYQLAGSTNYILSYERKRSILKNNIFGVDIDPLAVEVSKFSLLLKALENSSLEEAEAFHQRTNQRILPNLDENIKNGNSLVNMAYAFLIRQAHLYPRMILNEKKALVTDTLHKVRFLEGIDGKQVTAAFLNTYTFALSETLGRSYGGGVLTFEPGEIRKIRIPMHMADQLDLQKIDTWQRQGEIDKVLEYTDSILLRKGLSLTEHEIKLLHSIWKKMCDRRMSRKNQKK